MHKIFIGAVAAQTVPTATESAPNPLGPPVAMQRPRSNQALINVANGSDSDSDRARARVNQCWLSVTRLQPEMTRLSGV